MSSGTSLYDAEAGFRWQKGWFGRRVWSLEGTHGLGYRLFPGFRFSDGNLLDLRNQGLLVNQNLEVVRALWLIQGISLFGRGEALVDSELGYQEWQRGGKLGFQWRPWRGWVFSIAPAYTLIDYYAFPSQQIIFEQWFDGRLADSAELKMLSVELSVDAVDDSHDPSEGIQFRLKSIPVGKTENQQIFHRILVDSRGILSVYRWTWSLRMAGGHLFWPSGQPDLLAVRFFLGGSTDIRGWGRRALPAPGYTGGRMAPAVGGDSMLMSSVEGKYQLFPQLALLGFVDAGRVWEASRDLSSGWGVDLHQVLPSAGLGTKIPTPFGDARISMAYQLRKPQTLLRPPARWGLHFQLNQELF